MTTNDTNKAKNFITVDYDLYAEFLGSTDLTEDQKREFLQAMWNIICEFVALGFGVHPLQQAQSTCGQLPKEGGNPPTKTPCVLDCHHPDLIDLFKSADAKIPEKAGEESNHDNS